MFRGKRGDLADSVWSIIISLILVAFIFVSLYRFVYSESIAEQYQLNYMAADIALLLDAIQAAPGDVVITYPQDTTGLAFDFSAPGIVIVYHAAGYNQKLSKRGAAAFKESADYSFDHTVLSPGSTGKVILTFSKSSSAGGSRIAITDAAGGTKTAGTSQTSVSCPSVDTIGMSKSAFIDVDASLVPLKDLAESIKSLCSIRPSVYCEADDSIAGIVVRIVPGTESRKATIAISPSAEASAAACIILNNLEKEGFTIEPVKQTLPAHQYGAPMIEITISKIDDPAIASPEGKGKVAGAIASGLREFFSPN